MEINEILNGLSGAQKGNNCGNNGFGGSWIWIILLFLICGCNGNSYGGYPAAGALGNTYTCKCKCKKNKDCCGQMACPPYAPTAGYGFNSWWIIILLIFFCCCGRGNNGFCNDRCDDNTVCV